jgi:septal ring factor EnvC (AmiA/AmiB activator)
MAYLGALASHDRSMIEDYARDLARMDARKRELHGLLVRQKAEARRVSAVESDLGQQKRSKEDLLAVLVRQKAASEHLVKELASAANQLREVIRRAEKKRSAFGGTGFQALKGRLPWPVAGEVAIPYGTTRDPRYETPVFRNGIYITAARGVVTTAVSRGEVVFADWFKGYGHLVILNHGQGYHTLYANLSEIFLKKGDIIEEGNPVGRVGESGVLDRASLYFEIRYKGKALNPAHWLGSK